MTHLNDLPTSCQLMIYASVPDMKTLHSLFATNREMFQHLRTESARTHLSVLWLNERTPLEIKRLWARTVVCRDVPKRDAMFRLLMSASYDKNILATAFMCALRHGVDWVLDRLAPYVPITMTQADANIWLAPRATSLLLQLHVDGYDCDIQVVAPPILDLLGEVVRCSVRLPVITSQCRIIKLKLGTCDTNQILCPWQFVLGQGQIVHASNRPSFLILGINPSTSWDHLMLNCFDCYSYDNSFILRLLRDHPEVDMNGRGMSSRKQPLACASRYRTPDVLLALLSRPEIDVPIQEFEAIQHNIQHNIDWSKQVIDSILEQSIRRWSR